MPPQLLVERLMRQRRREQGRMPIYQYRCKAGHLEEELERAPVGPQRARRCKTCGRRSPPVITVPVAQVWEPLFLEHVSREGKLFPTKAGLKQHCRDHGIASNALL